MDFIHDQLAMGKKHRILTVVGTHSRLCPAADPRVIYQGEDVVQTLERVCARVGYRKTIRVDNGSEFISRDMDLWAYQRGVTLNFSRPGKPTDNAFIEAFNGRFRAECPNAHWFLTLADAAEKLEAEFHMKTEPTHYVGGQKFHWIILPEPRRHAALYLMTFQERVASEILRRTPPNIHESYHLDHSYRYGVGLKIVMDTSVIDRSDIEYAILRFRDLGENEWQDSVRIPSTHLPDPTYAEALAA